MNYKKIIESILFISHKAITAKEAASLCGVSEEEAHKLLSELFDEYRDRDAGISLLKVDNKYHMATCAEAGEAIAKFLKTELTGELTRPALEALTIIAYRGPISKNELELIRGVNCSMILRNLLMRGLIDSAEDKDAKIEKFSITFEFLKFLGITDVSMLPDYEKLNKDSSLDKLLNSLANE